MWKGKEEKSFMRWRWNEKDLFLDIYHYIKKEIKKNEKSRKNALVRLDKCNGV